MGAWVRDDVMEAFSELLAEPRGPVLGWKIGVATPASMANAGIDAPLVGPVAAAGLIASEASVDVSHWTRPVLEPEIAVYLGADVPAGASREQASAAIAEVSLAFELVDIAGPLTDAPAMLRAGIFHRGVILGERVSAPSALPAATLLVDGAVAAEVADPTAATGDHAALVQHIAAVLGAAGQVLRAGQLIITGTIAPPLPLASGSSYALRAPGLGEISLEAA